MPDVLGGGGGPRENCVGRVVEGDQAKAVLRAHLAEGLGYAVGEGVEFAPDGAGHIEHVAVAGAVGERLEVGARRDDQHKRSRFVLGRWRGSRRCSGRGIRGRGIFANSSRAGAISFCADDRPAGPLVRDGAADWHVLMESGALTAEELLRRDTRIVFAQAGSIEETARRLDRDRRTVQARLGRAGICGLAAAGNPVESAA